MDRPRSIHVHCFERGICNARMVRERVFVEVAIPSGILIPGALSWALCGGHGAIYSRVSHRK